MRNAPWGEPLPPGTGGGVREWQPRPACHVGLPRGARLAHGSHQSPEPGQAPQGTWAPSLRADHRLPPGITPEWETRGSQSPREGSYPPRDATLRYVAGAMGAFTGA